MLKIKKAHSYGLIEKITVCKMERGPQRELPLCGVILSGDTSHISEAMLHLAPFAGQK